MGGEKVTPRLYPAVAVVIVLGGLLGFFHGVVGGVQLIDVKESTVHRFDGVGVLAISRRALPRGFAGGPFQRDTGGGEDEKGIAHVAFLVDAVGSCGRNNSVTSSKLSTTL